MEPITLDGKTYSVAILHSIAVIYLDNGEYINYIKNFTNSFFQIVKMYVENGVRKQLYVKRTELLQKIYSAKESNLFDKMNKINALD